MSQSELARQSGKSQSSINVIIAGRVKNPGGVENIAKPLGVSVNWLLGIDIEKPANNIKVVQAVKMGRPVNKATISRDFIPIKAIAAGDLMSGKALPTKDIGRIPWPPTFMGMEDVYSVFISGDSMSPAFNNKDIALISPYLPYGKGDIVVFVEKHSDHLNEKMSIKQFGGTEGGMTTFTQLNPNILIRIPTNKILYIHKILSHREIIGL